MQLGELIKTRKKELGLKWEDMVARAQASGYPVGRNYMMQIIRQGISNPLGADTIRGIAAAIDLPPMQVYRAAGESLGLDAQDGVMEAEEARWFVSLVANRSPAEQRALRAAVIAQIAVMDLPRSGDGLTGSEDHGS